MRVVIIRHAEVISRFVYFEFYLENGRIQTLKVGFGEDIEDMISIIPFYFLVDRYDGWKTYGC